MSSNGVNIFEKKLWTNITCMITNTFFTCNALFMKRSSSKWFSAIPYENLRKFWIREMSNCKWQNEIFGHLTSVWPIYSSIGCPRYSTVPLDSSRIGIMVPTIILRSLTNLFERFSGDKCTVLPYKFLYKRL